MTESVMMYNNTVYRDWNRQSIEYKMKTPKMNPETMCSYVFKYGESGAPVEYARTSFFHGTVSTEQCKIKKSLFRRFQEYKIPWFEK